MVGENPPTSPSAQTAAPPSLCPPSLTTTKLTLSQQTFAELPAAGEVLGDPQPHASGEVDVVLHASGEVGREPKMSGEIHGKLPKKIRKKLDAIFACFADVVPGADRFGSAGAQPDFGYAE